MNIPLWKLLEVGSWAVSLVAVVGFFWLVRRETAKARLIVEAAAARVGGSPTASGFVGTVRGVPVELAFHSSRSGGYYVGTIEAPTGTPVYSVRPRGWFTGLGGMDVIDGIFGLHARDRPRAREAWTPALEAAFVDLVQPRRGALAWVEGGVECDGRLDPHPQPEPRGPRAHVQLVHPCVRGGGGGALGTRRRGGSWSFGGRVRRRERVGAWVGGACGAWARYHGETDPE
jgi:hypothetical protein